MRKFNLMEEYSSIISNSNIINLISKIHEYKGKQSYLLDTKKDTLETLLKVAKIQSTSSSNKIEGIYTTDKRINEIVSQKLEPKNRNEEEIAGYRDVLTLIHENYNFIDINQNTILQLHRNLYKYTGYSYGGKFKNSQNYIEEENEKGEKKIRFTPLSPVETPIAIENLCKNYNKLVNNEFDNEKYNYFAMHQREEKQATTRIGYAEDYLMKGRDEMGAYYMGQWYAITILLKIYKKYAFQLTGESI